MSRVLASLVLLLLVLWPLQNFSPSHAQQLAPQATDAAFQEELDKGKDLFRRRQYDDAVKSFRRANEMHEKKCAACYAWMTEAFLALEAYRSVITAADKVAEFAKGDPQLLVKA